MAATLRSPSLHRTSDSTENRISLTTPETVKFIRLYQKHELLWNSGHPHYNSKQARVDTLKVLAEVMGKSWTEQEVRDKVLSLRSRYCKELAKVRTSIASGVAGEKLYTPVWRFFPLLDSFLRPYSITRKPDTPAVRAFAQRLLNKGNIGPTDAQNATIFSVVGSEPVLCPISSVSPEFEFWGDAEIENDELQIISDEEEDSKDDISVYLDNANILEGSSHNPNTDQAKADHACDSSLTAKQDSPSLDCYVTTLQNTPSTEKTHSLSVQDISLDTVSLASQQHAELTATHISSFQVPRAQNSAVPLSNQPLKQDKYSTPPSPPQPPLPCPKSEVPTPHSRCSKFQHKPSSQFNSNSESKSCLDSEPLSKRSRSDDVNLIREEARTNGADFTQQMLSLMQTMMDSVVKNCKVGSTDDADTAFANYVVCELKKFDEDLKSQLKFNIQKAIYETQMEMRQRKQQ